MYNEYESEKWEKGTKRKKLNSGWTNDIETKWLKHKISILYQVKLSKLK